MNKRSKFKAAGKNDVWFAVFFIAAIVIVSLLANADKSNAPKRPGFVPAAQIKD